MGSTSGWGGEQRLGRGSRAARVLPGTTPHPARSPNPAAAPPTPGGCLEADIGKTGKFYKPADVAEWVSLWGPILAVSRHPACLPPPCSCVPPPSLHPPALLPHVHPPHNPPTHRACAPRSPTSCSPSPPTTPPGQLTSSSSSRESCVGGWEGARGWEGVRGQSACLAGAEAVVAQSRRPTRTRAAAHPAPSCHCPLPPSQAVGQPGELCLLPGLCHAGA